ncbi:galactoside 2-alpha-L-fucosyltransferase SEC1-like [Neocloeon triangulifer]|uniref:galactoside 2-alpha-L-fucosyltransferase SEC1-like n=1 Tax=Neocloeon triangulifer TaxID=2078957 RepID=UPI00286F0DD4|nr:galactoside 2-alpha-L-fucosyltransferase SEC1-like [Neocloeon triangulifer]XP_059468996.1 galactoside 2-alpha-L-fucosyltransferase SEC1-like [Neocloeon triangulifer]
MMRKIFAIVIAGVIFLVASNFFLVHNTTVLFLPKAEAVQGHHLYPCPKIPIVTIEDGGRLGNKIWEYAAVWSVARLMGRPGFVPRSLKTTLSRTFGNLSLPTLEEIGHCDLQLNYNKSISALSILPLTETRSRFQGRNMLLHRYEMFLEPALMYRDLLKLEFSFKPEIVRQVKETFAKFGEGKTLVGVHVRRTDFKEFLPVYLKTTLVNDDFYKNAMQWYRENVKGPILFLVVSDDISWCETNLRFEDVRVVTNSSPAHDLALLCMSDHTIVDYGTFGFWGAFMSEGHTVSLGVYKSFTKTMAQEANWTLF